MDQQPNPIDEIPQKLPNITNQRILPIVNYEQNLKNQNIQETNDKNAADKIELNQIENSEQTACIHGQVNKRRSRRSELMSNISKHNDLIKKPEFKAFDKGKQAELNQLNDKDVLELKSMKEKNKQKAERRTFRKENKDQILIAKPVDITVPDEKRAEELKIKIKKTEIEIGELDAYL